MATKTVFNLDADTGANIIGNEATPMLELTNSGAGASMALDKIDVNTPILAANATVGTGVDIRGASVASGAAIAFTGDALVSCTSILFTTGGVSGTKAIRIVQADGTFAWIPVLPDAAVTGAAI